MENMSNPHKANSNDDDASSDEEEYYSAEDSLDSDDEQPTSQTQNVEETRLSKSPEIKEEEVEFTVKNLDTGQSFSSKEIDTYIPKGIDPSSLDPIAYNILRRSPDSQSSEDYKAESSKPQKKSRWLAKIAGKSETKRKLFGQVSRQQIRKHEGPIWVLKFNYDGIFAASGGNDTFIYIWKVIENGSEGPFFAPDPARVFKGHTGDILALSWSNSRSNLLLSASMDKTVRLWEVNNQKLVEAKGTFQHEDVVTCVVFHPKNEELFISGGLDNKLQIWNLVEKKVISSIVVDCGFITSAAITPEGETVIIGSYDSNCLFFRTSDLHLLMQKHIRAKGRKRGKKITGIEVGPGGKSILVTSNDSRIHLMSLTDYSMVCSFKGLKNENFQIFATFSEKGKYIICGSEDHHVYLWDNENLPSNTAFLSKSVKTHDSFQVSSNTVTVAVFAPFSRRKTKLTELQIIVTCDLSGEIKVTENKKLS